MTGSNLKDRITIQTLEETAEGFAWVPSVSTWAQSAGDRQKNLFSSIGIGARGVTFRIRKRPITLHQSILWQGQHCFLTSILPVPENHSFLEIKAALCPIHSCTPGTQLSPDGPTFPAVLTERYMGHETPDLHSELRGDYVLVTPKVISLEPGSWVTIDGRTYRVEAPHLLDPYKNEYELRWEGDC